MTVDPALPGRLIDQESRYGASHDQPCGVVFTRADGVYLWDVHGNRYMDFLASHGVVAQGHNHTRIAAAMVEQCLRLCLTSSGFRNDRRPPLLEKLCTLAGFEKALFLNSGAEAVETAIQGIRKWGEQEKGIAPGRGEILVFSGNDHGRTTTLLSCSDRPLRTQGFGPFTPGFRLLPFGDLGAVKAAAGPNTCGVLVEPVQGEAGVVLPVKGFLKGLREVCDSRRIMLIADEIQSGLGRTGKLFAFEHDGIRPDGVVLGGALSGGFYPVSAVLGAQEWMRVFTPGSHGSTFGGNPLACAVASAALDVLADEKLVDRSAELGAYLLERLRSMDSPLVREIRGIGLWAGIELLPEAGPAHLFCDALRQEGLLCCDGGEQTIRLTPPLIITREQLDWALGKIKLVLGA
jgi:ornithine--oxo-acid transaminase